MRLNVRVVVWSSADLGEGAGSSAVSVVESTGLILILGIILIGQICNIRS